MDGGGRTRDGGSAGSSIGVDEMTASGARIDEMAAEPRLSLCGVSLCAENASYADGGVIESQVEASRKRTSLPCALRQRRSVHTLFQTYGEV